MIIDSSNTIYFCFIHAAITICFTSYMIFNFGLVLMILCKFINKSFIPTVCAQTLGSYQKYVLYFVFSLHFSTPIYY